ncbi:MAG: SIS domain-containing protein [Deltaproteobacteria bacterium]|nr:SIS domain-containing protein [Deltaproteobacteria bacterium]
MNNIERLISENKTFEGFTKDYFSYLSYRLNQLDTKVIALFVKELEIAWNNENTVFLAGNGGSAVTASHMANDIGVDVLKKGGGEKPFRVMALTDNVSVMTAIANDDGYENLFVNQLRIHYRQGDKLVVISASGNSQNVVAAAEWTKKRGGKIIGLLGFGGGKLKDICDIVINVKTPDGEYGPVEDIHMIINHVISNWLIYKSYSEG